MNKKATRPQQAPNVSALCADVAVVLNDIVRRVGPPEAARRHFEASRVEFLKGLRALLDARIERRSKRGAKGQKIDVE